jgi:hypothetical protein
MTDDARRGLAAAALAAVCLVLATPPAAAETDFGVRYWYGFGETALDLYDFDRTTMLSRLSYRDLTTNGGELYGRIGEGGLFVRGFAGFGTTEGGHLQDEDFGLLSGYSSTNSSQHGGKVSYATADVGFYFAGGQHARLGALVGFNYFGQEVSAYGCEQTGGNLLVCNPTIDPAVLVITQTNNWQSLRLGLSGDVRAGRLRFGGDAAAVYSQLAGADSHWLRIGTHTGEFTGSIPADGKGWGYQFEATVDYQVMPAFVVGAGVRYWHMQSSGDMHFEDHVVGGGGGPQRVDWQATQWGYTLHAAWRF